MRNCALGAFERAATHAREGLSRADGMGQAVASGIVSRPWPIETSEAQAQRIAPEPGPKGDA